MLLREDAVAPVADPGLWQHLDVEALTVRDCAALVGALSDNLATNVLVDHLGLPHGVADELRLTATRLHDVVRDARGAQHPPALSTGTARELAGVLSRLHRGEVDGGAQVLRWLAAGTDLSMVAAALGLDPLAHVDADRGLRLVDKTGTDTGVRADVGLVTGRRTLAHAVLARFDDADRDAVLAAARAIGDELLRQVQ